MPADAAGSGGARIPIAEAEQTMAEGYIESAKKVKEKIFGETPIQYDVPETTSIPADDFGFPPTIFMFPVSSGRASGFDNGSNLVSISSSKTSMSFVV